MRFAHVADMHFDTAFTSLENRKELGDLRRLEQREVFKKMISEIKKREIPYLFIAGDLYEQKYIKQTTIEYINNLFKEIPNTQIFISPGNHDPYLQNSFYAKFNWTENVHIFKGKIEKIETPEADIYGVGFTEYYEESLGIENLETLNPNKINIAVVHGTIDGSDKVQMMYNPMSSKKLIDVGFDYVACGHIHKREYIEKNKIVYPGSMISFGFDEPGEHGMLIGEINKNKNEVEFIKLDERVFEEVELDISEINSEAELIEKINNLNYEKNVEIKLIITGVRNFEINRKNILKLIQNEQIVKIKNNTKIKYNLEEIAKENNLKGIFVKKILENKNYTEEEILKAIEIGLEVL